MCGHRGSNHAVGFLVAPRVHRSDEEIVAKAVRQSRHVHRKISSRNRGRAEIECSPTPCHVSEVGDRERGVGIRGRRVGIHGCSPSQHDRTARPSVDGGREPGKDRGDWVHWCRRDRGPRRHICILVAPRVRRTDNESIRRPVRERGHVERCALGCPVGHTEGERVRPRSHID